MTKLRLAAAGIALIVLALPTAATAAVELRAVDAGAYPTIRASVVTSKASTAPPIVTENGLAVTDLRATNLAQGKSVVLAIDASQSMKGKPLAEAVAAARAFVAAKPQTDRIAVTAFATSARFLTGFSQDKSSVFGALDSVKVDPEQGTMLYDDLVLASKRLGRVEFAGRVVIIVTDGNETRSKSSLEEAIAAARKAQTSVYVVAIESPQFNPAPLQQIAEQTGGRYFGTESSSGIAGVYSAIARELARTWRVEYLTAARPGDRIRVSAAFVGEGTATGLTRIPRSGGKQAEPSKLLPEGAYGPGGPLGLAAAVAVLMLLACLFFLAGVRGSWVRSRIAGHVGDTRGNSRRKRKERRGAMLSTLFRATEKAFGNLKQWRWMGRMLERADIPLKTAEFFWIMMGFAAVAGLVTFAMGRPPVFIAGSMVFAMLLPLLWAWRKMRSRLNAFEDQLPDMLITIAASLKAGHSFKQGLQAVVDEGHPPANEEFKRVLTETSLGRPMDDALAEMSDRCGSKNFEFAITAVTIQRQVGGSLATLFDMVADTVRQRQQFARKVKGLTAMGRMSAYTLVGVPFFIAGTVTLINPSYMHPLYHTGTGQFLIGMGLVMMALGSFFLKKIVTFKG